MPRVIGSRSSVAETKPIQLLTEEGAGEFTRTILSSENGPGFTSHGTQTRWPTEMLLLLVIFLSRPVSSKEAEYTETVCESIPDSQPTDTLKRHRPATFRYKSRLRSLFRGPTESLHQPGLVSPATSSTRRRARKPSVGAIIARPPPTAGAGATRSHLRREGQSTRHPLTRHGLVRAPAEAPLAGDPYRVVPSAIRAFRPRDARTELLVFPPDWNP